MKLTWRYWVNKEGKPMSGAYYVFRSWKVYWAYRWYQAVGIDKYTAVTPVKKQWGNVIEPTKYADKY